MTFSPEDFAFADSGLFPGSKQCYALVDDLKQVLDRIADLQEQVMSLRKFIWAHVEAHNAIPEWHPRVNVSPT